ncbi:MAG: GIY-YIG nuclease family protein [Candidatus Roizmanbacteria bacterium]|nr:GIY-YIG nuclease family protein [Candidatus Roizmanbacteria bacterium]
MYYTYVLISTKNKRLYVGSTDNLKRRIKEHNDGIGGVYTRINRPFTLLFYEAYISQLDAKKQEKFYKTGYGREVLRGKIESSLIEVTT